MAVESEGNLVAGRVVQARSPAVRGLVLAASTWSFLVAGIAAAGLVGGKVSLSEGITPREVAAMALLVCFMTAGLVTGCVALRCARRSLVTPPPYMSFERRGREQRMARCALWISVAYVGPLLTLALCVAGVALANLAKKLV